MTKLHMGKKIWNKKDTSIQLRMPSELKEELTEVAMLYNDTPSGLARFLGDRTAVIKLCLLSFLEHYESRGKTTIPLDWKQILDDLNN